MDQQIDMLYNDLVMYYQEELTKATEEKEQLQ